MGGNGLHDKTSPDIRKLEFDCNANQLFEVENVKTKNPDWQDQIITTLTILKRPTT